MTHSAAFVFSIATFFGVVFTILSGWLRIPSIVLLLIGGFALGPQGIGIVHPEALGHGLETVVQLIVAIVLLEGGMALNLAGYQRSRTLIVRMLTVGVLITWFGASAALYLILDLPVDLSLLGGSLVIVTGPTVIAPLLERMNLPDHIHHALYWEGVFIDAIGVFIAVLCFEWATAVPGHSTLQPLALFALRVGFGVVAGGLAAWILEFCLQRKIVPEKYANIFILSSAIALFAGCNELMEESGILAVIIVGLILGIRQPPAIHQIKHFKEGLSQLGIGILFILLSARLQPAYFTSIGVPLLIVLAIIFALRPLNILAVTFGLGFSWKERIFLSWVAPRGIVAASMAALFAIQLQQMGRSEASTVEAFTFAVIGTTVVLQGLTAPSFARILGLREPTKNRVLLVGEPGLVYQLAVHLRDAGAKPLVMARSLRRYQACLNDGIEVVGEDPIDHSGIADTSLSHVGTVIAVSNNRHYNQLVAREWAPIIGGEQCFRWTNKPKRDSLRQQQRYGIPIWSEIASPAQLAIGFENGSHRLEATHPREHAYESTIGLGDLVLMHVEDEETCQVFADPRSEPVRPDGSTLVLRARISELKGLFKEAVIIHQAHETYEDAISDALHQTSFRLPDKVLDSLITQFQARDHASTAPLGRGVVIVQVSGLPIEESYGVIISLEHTLERSTPDDQPVSLLFTVLTPAGDTDTQLRSYGAVSRLTNDPVFVRALTEQTDEHSLIALIQEHE